MCLVNWGTVTLSFLVLTVLLSDATSEICKNTDNGKTFKQQVTKSLEEGSHSVSEFRDKIEGKDVVIFLGSTKSGKSTITNYLIGTKLDAYSSGITGLKIKENEDMGGPKIGQTSLSVTKVPGVYPVSAKPGMVVVDCPGFDDNRGPVQNLINALFINQIKHARTVKFVMVADIQEVANDNVNIFISSLNQMHELLRSHYDISPTSIAIIFTKVKGNWSRNDIADLLKKQIFNDDLKINKVLVRNIINDPQLIGIFKAPSKEGQIETDLGVNLLDAIEESEEIDMKQFQTRFALSEEARSALLEIYPEYTDTNYFKEEVDNIIKEYKDYFKDQWIFASYDEELTSAKSSLEAIKLSVKAQSSAHLTRLNDTLRSLEILLRSPTSKSFECSFKFVVNLEQSSIMEERYRSVIKANYFKSLKQLLDKLNNLLEKIEKELQERNANNIQFPSQRSYLATASTITYALVHKAYSATQTAANTVYNMVQAIPGKETLPQAVYAVVDIVDEKTKEATLKSVCTAAEKAAKMVISYGSEGMVVTGLGIGGTASYMAYEEIYGKRFEVRTAQGRSVYSWL